MIKEDILEGLINETFPTQVPVGNTEESILLSILHKEKYISCSFYSNNWCCIQITQRGLAYYYYEYLPNKDKPVDNDKNENKSTIINNVNIGNVKNMKNVAIGDNSKGDTIEVNGSKSIFDKIIAKVKL